MSVIKHMIAQMGKMKRIVSVPITYVKICLSVYMGNIVCTMIKYVMVLKIALTTHMLEKMNLFVALVCALQVVIVKENKWKVL